MLTNARSAAILIIGNEILSGRTRDTNIQMISVALGKHGIRVREARVVEDRYEAIVYALNGLRASHDFVFTTGGIGPTHDDITTECIAGAFGRVVLENPAAVERLVAYYGPAGMNEARLKMAHVVASATLIDNPISAAPGFRIENVFVLPGVPQILQAMLPSIIASLPSGQPILSRTITAWIREGEIASDLASVQNTHPNLDVGSYPFARDGRYGTSLVIRGTDAEGLELALTAVCAFLTQREAEFARVE